MDVNVKEYKRLSEAYTGSGKTMLLADYAKFLAGETRKRIKANMIAYYSNVLRGSSM